MNLDKEREAFSHWHEEKHGEYVTWCDSLPTSHIHNDRWEAWQAAKASANEKIEALQNAVIFADECRKEWHESYMRLREAKASAVPDGFVLIESKYLGTINEALILACGIRENEPAYEAALNHIYAIALKRMIKAAQE